MCIDEKAFALLVETVSERNKADREAHGQLWNAVDTLSHEVNKLNVQVNNGISDKVGMIPQMQKDITAIMVSVGGSKEGRKESSKLWLALIAAFGGGLLFKLITVLF